MSILEFVHKFKHVWGKWHVRFGKTLAGGAYWNERMCRVCDRHQIRYTNRFSGRPEYRVV